MKKTALSLALLLSGCLAPGPVLLETGGPLARQVERIVERHDKYVSDDLTLTTEQRIAYLTQSAHALNLVNSMESVPSDMLAEQLAPVMDRHDAYVSDDNDLDELEKGVYLGSTAELRSLLSRARANQTVQTLIGPPNKLLTRPPIYLSPMPGVIVLV